MERIPLAGIARAVTHKVEIEKRKRRLTIQCDEMWSFVGHKKNKQWIWLAIDGESHVIVGVHVGSRDRDGARQLWASMPAVYRQCAVCYTDFWEAYQTVIPSKRHRRVGKETSQTNYVERSGTTELGM